MLPTLCQGTKVVRYNVIEQVSPNYIVRYFSFVVNLFVQFKWFVTYISSYFGLHKLGFISLLHLNVYKRNYNFFGTKLRLWKIRHCFFLFEEKVHFCEANITTDEIGSKQ